MTTLSIIAAPRQLSDLSAAFDKHVTQVDRVPDCGAAGRGAKVSLYHPAPMSFENIGRAHRADIVDCRH
jgi:hypothetical protein